MTKDRLDHALLRHCAGESRPDHARPDVGNPAATSTVGERCARSCAHTKRPGPSAAGRRSVPSTCCSLAHRATPTTDAWSREKVDSWANDTPEVAEKHFPGRADRHRRAAHGRGQPAHARVPGAGARRKTFSWKKLVEDHTGKRGRASYRAMQDSYHAAVAHHGLARGDEGSERKHKKLSREAGIAAAREHAEKMAAASYERIRAKADADAERAADSYAMRAHREARERRAREQDREIGRRRERLEARAAQEARRRDAAKAAADREQSRAARLAQSTAAEAKRLAAVRAETDAERMALRQVREAADEADERLAEIEEDLRAKKKAQADTDRRLAETRAEHTRWERLVEGAKAKYGELQEGIGMLQARVKNLASTFRLLDADRERLQRGEEPEREWTFDGGQVRGVKRGGYTAPQRSPGGLGR